MPGFTISGDPIESAMPDGVNALVRWRLSGTPDGRWEADFSARWEAEFAGQWEIELPHAPHGQPGPSVAVPASLGSFRESEKSRSNSLSNDSSTTRTGS